MKLDEFLLFVNAEQQWVYSDQLFQRVVDYLFFSDNCNTRFFLQQLKFLFVFQMARKMGVIIHEVVGVDFDIVFILIFEQ